jgi:hypothetical protein
MANVTTKLHQVEFFLPRFGKVVKFPAYITDLTDEFSSDWQTDQQYGFQDPIGAFIGTTRKVSLSLRVVSDSYHQSAIYQGRLNQIVQSLYPIYSKGVVPSTSPIIGMKIVNLIHGGKTGNGFLFGWLDGLSLSPNVGEGGFYADKQQMLPKLWDLSFGFNVIHKERPGSFEEKKGTKFSLGDPLQFPVSVTDTKEMVNDLEQREKLLAARAAAQNPTAPNQASAGQTPAVKAGNKIGTPKNKKK